MTDKRRFSGDYANDVNGMHTSGGMTDPAAPTGPSADGADMASTDMSQEPSSREPETQAEFRGRGAGGAGVPMEPDPQAIRRLEDQLEQERDRHLRLAAEYDNFRKRAARERGELADRSQAALVMRLLDALDDMDRLAADGGSASAEQVRQAVELVDKKLRKELLAAGLERIDPVGAPFDPSLHEAVSTLPPPSPELDHQVSATFQAGYRFKGALVRPARVQVYAEQGHA
ncbi:MAG TPA: nucleotide exchange factor GrpE [Gemmatimonadales bacterium]|nr:nucleotide exchange factor GrpE [Gemmatimonadales bacterium]